jgi:hypothetical protein
VADNRFAMLYAEFGVSSEDELFSVMVKESLTIPCINCHREFTIDKLSFLTGDPLCFYCRR